MPFASSQPRLMMLIAMKYDLDLQMQFLMQHKHYLAKAVSTFMNLKVEYEPGTKADKMLEARIRQLNEAEKLLDTRMRSLQLRQEAIHKEEQEQSQKAQKAAQEEFGSRQ
jgi:hypothetical protein